MINQNELTEFISDIKLNLLFSEPILGYLISKVNIVEDNNIDTLLIYFNDEIYMYEIKYNFNFLLTLENIKEVNAVFKHELFHLIYKHHFRAIQYKRKNGFLDMKTANIAMDISINQYIDNLPDNALCYKDYDLEEGLDFETYYKLIYKGNKSNEDGNGKSGNSSGEGTSNSLGDNNSEGETEEISNEKDKGDNSKESEENNSNFSVSNSQKIKNQKKESQNKNHNELLNSVLNKDEDIIENMTDNLIQESIKNSHSKYGNGGFSNELNNLLKEKSVVSWKKIVKQFVEKTIISGETKSTWFKENRRFDYLKGKVKLKEAMILIAIDTSGSISEKIIYKFLNELQHISSNEMLNIIYFNSDIYNEIKDMKKEKNKLKNIQRGGTLFQPVLDYARKNKYKNLIMMTDGYGEYELELFNIKCIFINNNLKEIYTPKIKKIESSRIFNTYPTRKVSI